MPIDRPTLTELMDLITTDIESRLPGSSAKLRRKLLNIVGKVQAGAAHGLHGKIDTVAKNILPDTGDADSVKRWGDLLRIYKKAATYASTTLTIKGNDDAVLPEGKKYQRPDGVEYITTSAGTIVNGSAVVPVTAVESGKTGNADGGTVLTLVTPEDGIEPIAIMSIDGAKNASNIETDEAFKGRVLERMSKQLNGSNENIFVVWAKEVPGVTRAWCFPQHMGRGTVGVTFVCDDQEDDFIPSDEKVAEVDAYIESHPDPVNGNIIGRVVTAEVWTFAPRAKPVNPQIKITPDTPEIRAAVANELQDLLVREAEPGTKLYISKINEAISLAEGESNHTLLSPTEDILHISGEIPTVGTILWD